MQILKALSGMLKISHKRLYRAISPIGYAKSIGVYVGRNCRLINVDFGTEPYLVTLGDHVSATNTHFITHDGGVWVFRDEVTDIDKIAPIKIGNNVFFGIGAIVLPGVTIGDNVIIGAGAVVTKDIKPNCVAAGVPAKSIESLDEYLKSNEDKLLETKGLSRSEKKKYLLKHFNMNAMM